MTGTPKTTLCLWYDHDAEEAANFYAKTFPSSSVQGIQRAPTDYPNGKAGDAKTAFISPRSARLARKPASRPSAARSSRTAARS